MEFPEDGPGCKSFLPGQTFKVDTELLAFFVEMTAFKAERACGLRHVALMAIEFGQNRDAFEGEDALPE